MLPFEDYNLVSLAPSNPSNSMASGSACELKVGSQSENERSFSYDEAFCRNIGILTVEEQTRLCASRVALAGMGGVGGVYVEALARMGVGRFSIADGDDFEVVNFNRQMGGTLSSVGQNKARTMAQRIHAINPEATVNVWETHLNEGNVAEFLKDADVVVDAIEAFEIAAHRLLLREARARRLVAIFAAPMGFSAAMLIFGNEGMTADEYFDWQDGQGNMEQMARLALGVAPTGLHRANFDLRYVDMEQHTGPSNIAACLLCSGLVATEVARQLLRRPGARYAPAYLQFDSFSQRLSRGRLRWGNRGLGQRLKKWVLMRQFRTIHPRSVVRMSANYGAAPHT